MDHATIIGHVILFLTTVLGFAVQLYRESRNRRWLLEDAERKHTEIKDAIVKNGRTT